MSSFAWGLIGPGGIAQRFAEAVQHSAGMHLHSVWGRDAGRAGALAQRWAVAGKPAPQVAASLAALLADPAVQGVYIATPHAQHAEFAAAALRARKPVLCEKPLAPTLAQAQALVELSRQQGVFLMEALWSRFLPSWGQLRQWLAAGDIGAVRAVQSSFCFPTSFDPQHRQFNPALAGGALLDIGLYNLAATRWVLEPAPGQCPPARHISAQGVLAPTGVDMRVAGSLVFDGAVTSQFVCALDCAAPNTLHVLGERGSITLPFPFWGATGALLQRPGQPDLQVALPWAVNGFEYEAQAAVAAIGAGAIECAQMPHAETLALAGWLDELRRQVGVVYPFE